MSLRGFARWVRRCLALDRKHRPTPPTSAAIRTPPLVRTSKASEVADEPRTNQNEVSGIRTGPEIASPDCSEGTIPAIVADPSDEFQAAGTQFASHGTEVTDLVIGLDFGTLSTRVVVRSPYVGDGRAVPVYWQVRSDTTSQFLPVGLCEGPDGGLTLAPDWKQRENGNLKTDLMDRPDDLSARGRAAAYLGLALREARGHVLDTEKEVYGRYRLRWTVNLGIPSAGYADHEVRAAFLCVARAAWPLSRRSKPITLNAALAEVQTAEGTAGIEADPDLTGVNVIPEIAALVAGYARSQRRREGLHVMMDVGASTIDICGFGLKDDDGDDQYFLYTAVVERLGIRELHRYRMEVIDQADARHSLHAPLSLDPFSEVPASGVDYVAGLTDPLRKKLASVDDRYAEDCIRALVKVILELRGRRDPRSEAWRAGLPLFKAGGGGQHQLITYAVREANDRVIRITDTNGVRVEPLPTLEALAHPQGFLGDVSPKNRHQDRGGEHRGHAPTTLSNLGHSAERLGVAFGLSFDSFDIGQITPPGEIEDVPPMRRRQPVEYISKDLV